MKSVSLSLSLSLQPVNYSNGFTVTSPSEGLPHTVSGLSRKGD